MVSKNFYLHLIARVFFMAVTALLFSFLVLKQHYILAFFALTFLGLQTFYLIRYVNHTNRKIAYFFESIKNEDFTLRFPEKLSLKSMEELNHSLNMLNTMIQEEHLKNKAQEQYYQEILKQADIGILTFNDKGHILFANPRIEKLLNYKPLNHIKQLLQVDGQLYQLFKELKPFERKIFQLTNEREKIELAIKSSSIILDKQQLLLVVVQDIHKELDEKETDSWTRLIRVLTHEIMNSITPITSISDSILKYYGEGKDGFIDDAQNQKRIANTVKGLEVIKDQGANLMSFVQSYRSFLNIPAPDKKIVLAQELLDKVKLLMVQNQEFDNVVFEVVVSAENLELFIDEKQITQVLINLCKNALESMSDQEYGKIIITARTNDEGNRFIEVCDNGPGISPELIDEIFVPFFTTKSTGTGIGLSLSKQILRMHGGNLKVSSIPCEETIFRLLLN